MLTPDVNRKLDSAVESLKFIRESKNPDYRLGAIEEIGYRLTRLAKRIREER